MYDLIPDTCSATCTHYHVNNMEFVNEDHKNIVVKPYETCNYKDRVHKEEQEEIDKIKKGEPVPKTKTIINKDGRSYQYTTNKKFSYEVGRKRLVQLYKGLCTSCGDYPSYILSYDVGDENQGAKLIERYCKPCFQKWESRIKR